jgi:hypothetical protein
MPNSSTSAGQHDAPNSPRVVAIVAKQQIIEIWHIYRRSTVYKERHIEVAEKAHKSTLSGFRDTRSVYRHQLAQQEWGQFVIRRYQATRMLPWAPSAGLFMLIPGTLLAAGTANQGLVDVPLSLVIIQSALISIGGLLALASGWPILFRRLYSGGGVPVESLGVSGQAIGLPTGAVAAEPAPRGYRPKVLKGEVQVELPVGQWKVVEEHLTDVSWPLAY